MEVIGEAFVDRRQKPIKLRVGNGLRLDHAVKCSVDVVQAPVGVQEAVYFHLALEVASPGADVVRRHNQVLPELALKTNRPLVDKRLPEIIGSYLNARWTPRLYVTEWVSQSASSTCGNSDRQTNAVHEELELACFNHVMIEI